MAFDRLDLGVPVHRIGLGLAAVGRPGYINLGRRRDLPDDRSVEALRARSHELLDAAYAAGVRYVDVARSYGLAEEFLAGWLGDRRDVVVGSKWGYTYTAGWRVDAAVHEAKDHSVATFDRQVAETMELFGDRLDLYQIHSVTPDSTALTDRVLHRRLADLAARGVTVGLSTSGPRQADAIRAALRIEAGGAPLFRTVQATWNPLEPSAGPALAEAHADGRTVIVKESLANGRLAGSDAAVIAAALREPWAGVVLSGAATTAQLAGNLLALDVRDPGPLPEAETPEAYWRHRAALAWS
ncbi:aldo/keto reductase [Dactylosporangium sp. NBC_01737]|uniref:aldo/keto reductase n=1 Tax=Dactylosporangium sp. NBC_01737 TaxID=2975959 RepID=UPI002E12B1EF|nr:aldo/keto reductase [Dactylosporangium sp. NBC_01737]